VTSLSIKKSRQGKILRFSSGVAFSCIAVSDQSQTGPVVSVVLLFVLAGIRRRDDPLGRGNGTDSAALSSIVRVADPPHWSTRLLMMSSRQCTAGTLAGSVPGVAEGAVSSPSHVDAATATRRGVARGHSDHPEPLLIPCSCTRADTAAPRPSSLRLYPSAARLPPPAAAPGGYPCRGAPPCCCHCDRAHLPASHFAARRRRTPPSA